MASFHQMGHDSWNLVAEQHLSGFAGLVLSPVNDTPEDTKTKLTEARRTKPDLEVIFDPQLYAPGSQRGRLSTWPFFPSDMDSKDSASLGWWMARGKTIIEDAGKLSADVICSAANVPRVWNEEYYKFVVDVADDLKAAVVDSGTKVFLTGIFSMPTLAIKDAPQRFASILSATRADGIYVVFADDTAPRRELAKSSDLEGAAKLIRYLAEAGVRVFVSHASIDQVIWKSAGAHDIATGKFFNLRRFSLGRFDDDIEPGGRNFAYWTEPALSAFLREADLKRALNNQVVDLIEARRNPFATGILGLLEATPPRPWVALGWKQYMWWACDFEERFNRGEIDADAWLAVAEANWGKLSAAGVLFEEIPNDGNWARPWRIAIREALR